MYARCVYLKDNKCYIYFAAYWMKTADTKFHNNHSATVMRHAEHSVLNKLVFNSTQIHATFTPITKILQQHQVWQSTWQVSARDSISYKARHHITLISRTEMYFSLLYNGSQSLMIAIRFYHSCFVNRYFYDIILVSRMKQQIIMLQ